MLRAALDAAPWALPTTVAAALVAAVLARPLGRRVQVPTWLAWFTATSLAGFVALTTTPARGAGRLEISSHVIRSLALVRPDLGDLARLDEASLNLLVGVPMGLAAGLLLGRRSRAWPLLVLALPVLCELVQGLLPGLGRVGFLLDDVIRNEIGAVVGLALGTWSARRSGERSTRQVS